MNNMRSILIVDDEENACKVLARIFGKIGYDVATAVTGREAIETARSRAFDAALVDIRLPDMEGVELIAVLKAHHPAIVVVMVTGCGSVQTAERAVKEGAAAYILKPLDMDKVLSTLDAALAAGERAGAE